MIYDALIIGAGPAGATTALLLAQAGWKVAIVEKKKFPRRKVCGEFISATSLHVLQKMGVADFYLASSGPEICRVGLFAGETCLVSNMPKMTHRQGKWGRAFGREHLDTALLNNAKAAGVTCWQPFQLVKMHRSENLFTCTVTAQDQTKEISARVLIRAHGSWERNLESAQKEQHKSSDLLAFKAHFTGSKLEPDLMPLLAFPGGYGGMVHTDSGRVTLSCCIKRAMLQKIRQEYLNVPAGEAVLQHIMRHCRGVKIALAHAQREGQWLSAGPIKPGIRKRYADGVFYVGNIAAEAHPIVAEGISMAMQSGWLLADVLIQHGQDDIAAAGAVYSKQWQKHFSKRIHAAALYAAFATRPWAMQLILPAFKWLPGVLTLAAKLSGKIQQVVTLE